MLKVRCFGAVLLTLTFLTISGVPATEVDLDFEARVAAQAAIERVYHSHRIGAPSSFEDAVPREVLGRKVRTYLAQSDALERLWNTPVTADALRIELQRIASRTQLPDRLRELFAALNDDPVLIQECLVRQVLVDRLARDFFEADGRIHAAAQSSAEDLRADLLNGRLDLRVEHTSTDVSAGESGKSIRTLVLEADDYARLRGQAPSKAGEIGDLFADHSSYRVSVVIEEDPAGAVIATYTFPRVTWETWWADRSAALGDSAVEVVADEAVDLPNVNGRGGAPCDGDYWDNGALDDLPDQRGGSSVVWPRRRTARRMRAGITKPSGPAAS